MHSTLFTKMVGYRSDQLMSEGAISESYGSSDLERDYLLSEGKLIRLSDPKPTKLVTLSTFFRSVFLPQGYPDSVSSDYLEYQVWDTVQAFSSSITSSLATQAVLKGVGVGDDSATVAAATITWLLKDGTGMLGRIAFAWFKGSHLDCDCKKWRLFADVLNDVAIFLDILAPHFVNAFRGIVCVSGILRAVVGVAGGATRAAITQHQARRNNMADVAAKDGSQETLVNLMGLLCSLLLIPLISGKMILVWLFFSFFTMIHLLANYMAVTCIVIEIFNQSRLHIVAAQFFNSGTCPTVKETNYAEPILLDSKRLFTINLGCSLEKNLKRAGSYVISSKMYLIGLDPQQSAININLCSDSSFADQLRSCFHAELIEFCFKNSKKSSILQLQTQDLTINHLIYLISQGHIREMLAESKKFVDASWNRFADMALNAGWKLSPNLLGADEWRIK